MIFNVKVKPFLALGSSPIAGSRFNWRGMNRLSCIAIPRTFLRGFVLCLDFASNRVPPSPFCSDLPLALARRNAPERSNQDTNGRTVSPFINDGW
jgi:hypothetical protein